MTIKTIRRGLLIFGLIPAAVLGFAIEMFRVGYKVGKDHVSIYIEQLSD